MEEIENTRNKLPNDIKQFFYKLSNYLDTELYFYGSVQRYDYLPENSDIDVGIFTENVHSTIAKLQHYLHIERKAFKKFVLIHNGILMEGYKIKYNNESLNLTAEFAVYNKKDEEIRKNQLWRYNNLPFYLSISLYILKVLHYRLKIISYKTYMKYKMVVLHVGEQQPIFKLFK